MSPAASAPFFSHLPRPLLTSPPMLSTLLLRHRLTAAASPTRSPLRVLAAMSSSASSSSPHGGRKPNRLAAEHSPYLLQHAHNPVDWYPWGEEAFEKARAKDVPIFLSIGYSTCHWCHVMEVESFENEEVAKLLNDWFVSIKVDREERPDVDKVYMTYVSALHGGGGWPLSVFLSPNLKPLMGGTYFPPDDNYGRPGFKTVLRKVKEAWETKRDALERTGNLVIEQLRDALSAEASSQDLPNDLSVVSVDQCVEKIEDALGENAELFKNHYYVKSSGNCDLSPMSDPHNEFKGKNVLIERRSASLMASKSGKALDEYSQILGTCRQKLFDIRSKRPRPHLDDKVIVSWNGLAISAFARASQILKSGPTGTRFNFPVTGCNPVEYLEVAEEAANFIKEKLYDASSKRLHHSYRNGPSKAPGFLDDYAFLINGLLDLYEFGGNIEWLLWAVQLQVTQDELFLDKQGGGYFNTPGEDPSVLLRVKEDYDGAEPSGNSVAAINLIRLSSIFDATKSTGYKRNVEHLLAVFETRLRQLSIALPLMCCTADMLSVLSRKQVVLVGQKGSVEFQDMVAAAFSSYDPNRTVIQIDPKNAEEMEFWDSNNASIAQMARSSPLGKQAVAHVCQNFKCSPPVTSPEALRELLNKTVAAASSAA
ncbi:unnamed protein product [Urochloa humidicola]